jgi:hypothetical protein
MLSSTKTPFLASYPPDWDQDETRDAIILSETSSIHYDHISQTSNIPLEAGTAQTFKTTRSGGPILFSDDDSKAIDG